MLWKSYEEFKADMGDSYRDGLTIERNDVNGDYCKENCCWLDGAEQKRNTRHLVWISFNGKKMYLTDWARSLKMHPTTLRGRLQEGWTISEALTIPLGGHRTMPR